MTREFAVSVLLAALVLFGAWLWVYLAPYIGREVEAGVRRAVPF